MQNVHLVSIQVRGWYKLSELLPNDGRRSLNVTKSCRRHSYVRSFQRKRLRTVLSRFNESGHADGRVSQSSDFPFSHCPLKDGKANPQIQLGADCSVQQILMTVMIAGFSMAYIPRMSRIAKFDPKSTRCCAIDLLFILQVLNVRCLETFFDTFADNDF